MKPSAAVRGRRIAHGITVGALVLTVLALGVTIALPSLLRPPVLIEPTMFMPNKVLGVVVDEHLVIQDIEPGSGAEKGGLQRGDQVVSLYGTPVTTIPELIAQLKYARGDADTFPNGVVDPAAPDFPARRARMEQARDEMVIGIARRGQTSVATIALELPYAARRHAAAPPQTLVLPTEQKTVTSSDQPTRVPARGAPTATPAIPDARDPLAPPRDLSARSQPSLPDDGATPTPVPQTMFYF